MPLIVIVDNQYSVGQTIFIFPLGFCKQGFPLFFPNRSNNLMLLIPRKLGMSGLQVMSYDKTTLDLLGNEFRRHKLLLSYLSVLQPSIANLFQLQLIQVSFPVSHLSDLKDYQITAVKVTDCWSLAIVPQEAQSWLYLTHFSILPSLQIQYIMCLYIKS